MGKLFDELWDRVSELGPPFADGLKSHHLRPPRYEGVEESDEVLIFEVVRHESADGASFSGGPAAFMYVERRRYHYRGGDDITIDVVGESILEIDESVFLSRESNELQGCFQLGDTVDETREELNSLSYDIKKALYEQKGMDFDSFLDKLAQELHR